ncbi:MAG: hypothetical protein QW767_04830 [Thermoprotei archaeon]
MAEPSLFHQKRLIFEGRIDKKEAALTDPLSSKELVDKCYVYVDRVIKECRKSFLAQYAASKKKFAKSQLELSLGRDLESWFMRRDKLLNVKFDPQSVRSGPKGDTHFTLKGATKDAKFVIHCDAETVKVPGDESSLILSSANIHAERADFQKP